MIYDIGFETSFITDINIRGIYSFSFFCIACSYFAKVILNISSNLNRRKRFFDIFSLCIFAFIYLSNFYLNINSGSGSFIYFLTHSIFHNRYFIYTTISYLFFLEISKNFLFFYKLSTNPFKVFIFSYIVLILTGTAFLLLPRSTNGGISFIDALFTSSSAVCVTGLIVVDTATQFSFMGQIIILFLIQLGGVGFMTFTSFFALFSENKFSFQNQIFLKNIVNENQIGQILKTILKIIFFTFAAELIGAILIYKSLHQSILFDKSSEGIFFSVFHSISAFCNAGFSTATDGLNHISIRYNYNMHLIISFLIIAGGLGFPLVFNYYKYFKFHISNLIRRFEKKENFHHFPRLVNVYSKIVLITTVLLIIFGFVAFYLTENNNILEGKSLYGKIVTAFFCSVTPRTAGFNTIDYSLLTVPSIFICIFLMWVGASPNSTGGGIKTTAFALSFLNILSIGKGKDRVELNKRRITEESLHNAFAVIILSIVVIGISFFLIAIFDPMLPLRAVLFECVSAFSTVGLSMGVTYNLSDYSKLVLVISMIIGRVGTLSIIMAFIGKMKNYNYAYPSENIII
ncbi:MAG: potassium transporter TrkG [Bacteroidales bacterium]|nr:potassium transporter TrkG [Bacteroidales bacterium]